MVQLHTHTLHERTGWIDACHMYGAEHTRNTHRYCNTNNMHLRIYTHCTHAEQSGCDSPHNLPTHTHTCAHSSLCPGPMQLLSSSLLRGWGAPISQRWLSAHSRPPSLPPSHCPALLSELIELLPPPTATDRPCHCRSAKVRAWQLKLPTGVCEWGGGGEGRGAVQGQWQHCTNLSSW